MQVPLVLAAAEPVATIYRSVNSYPHLAETAIAGNPETTAEAELGPRARLVLDDIYAAELAAWRERYAMRANGGRGTRDVAEVARAATFGLVDMVMVDIDAALPRTVNEETGAVNTSETGPDTYSVLDEIARRVWLGCWPSVPTTFRAVGRPRPPSATRRLEAEPTARRASRARAGRRSGRPGGPGST